MPRLVTRSELARIAGVSPAAITKACKASLSEGCVGKRVDLDHPVVVKYLRKKGVAPTSDTVSAPAARSKPTKRRPRSAKKPAGKKPPQRPPKKKSSASAASPTDVPDVTDDDIEAYAHMSLDELVERFGTATAFKDWLDSRKTIEDIRQKTLKNNEIDGRLISRDLVRAHVFGAIESGNRRLLGDSPKTIARRLYALAKNGTPVEEAEAIVREIISSQLAPVKAQAARALRNA